MPKSKPKHNGSFKSAVWGLSIVFRASPSYVIGTVISGMLEAMGRVIEGVILLAYLINCIEYHRPFIQALYVILGFAAFMCLKFLWDAICEQWIKPKGAEKIKLKLSVMLYEKAVGMDIMFYDDPKFYNDFVWSMNNASEKMLHLVQMVYFAAFAVTSIIATGIYVSLKDPIGIVFAAVATVLGIVTTMLHNRIGLKIENDKKPWERRRDYVNRIFYLADYAKDLRMGEMKDGLLKTQQTASDEMEKTIDKHKCRILGISALSTITSNSDLFYLVWVLFRCLIKRAMSLGTMVSSFNAFGALTSHLDWFASLIPDIQKDGLYIERMKTFLETENIMPDNGSKKLGKNFDIQFKNVSFTYPNTERPVLKNINIKIPSGSKISLVGYNGAGKSTLVKLIMRLYDPTEGEITCGGTDIKDYRLKDYRARIRTLFQDYRIMAATLGENITMSDSTVNKQEALRVINDVGFDNVYNSLPNGLDTPLTKEFYEDGVNLSGGEQQKVAICRVLYENPDIMILDEPSSALDPLSEYRLNNTIDKLSGGKTVIFISHRLSTTKYADKIYMLKNGEIIEQGSHSELMEQDGEYAAMFKLQAQKYR